MDYVRARDVLRERRFELRLSIKDLASMADVERTTVYRVENTKAAPDYRPDFETMEKLASAMNLTLSQFFARIEGLPSDGQAVTLPITPELGAPAHVPSASEFQRMADLCFRAAERSGRLTVRGLLADLAYAFQQAALPGGQTTDHRRDEAGSAAGDRRVG